MITNEQLCEFFANEGLLQERTLDRNYSLVDESFIEVFAKDFHSLLYQLNLLMYAKDSNDCDKFAYLAWSYARLCHGRMKTGTGLGMGVVLYQPDNSEQGHAINVWILRVNGKLIYKFWEPQTQKEVSLSQNEKDSISGITI